MTCSAYVLQRRPRGKSTPFSDLEEEELTIARPRATYTRRGGGHVFPSTRDQRNASYARLGQVEDKEPRGEQEKRRPSSLFFISLFAQPSRWRSLNLSACLPLHFEILCASPRSVTPITPVHCYLSSFFYRFAPRSPKAFMRPRFRVVLWKR